MYDHEKRLTRYSSSRIVKAIAWTCFCFAPISTALSAATPRPIHSLASFAHISAKDAGNVRIDDTQSEKGLGVYTISIIQSGSRVGDYIGESLTLPQVQARYWNKRKTRAADRRWLKSRKQRNMGISGDYLFDMGDDLFIDGEDADRSGWCRFINHASEKTKKCNLEARCTRETWNGKEFVKPKLWFIASRDIGCGEELCYDYGDSFWDEDEASE